MTTRRRFIAHSTAIAAAAALPGVARAQEAWPTKPIRVVIPYAGGGVTDILGRKLVEQMAQVLGQPMLVENKSGAGGTLGMSDVLKANPDGYTVALTAISPLVLSPHLMKVPYDARKGITPVSSMMYSPVYVLATSAFAGKTWKELIDYARAKPGHIRVATAGIGSVSHVMLEQIQLKTGVQMVHVPYKGTGQMVTDAVGAHFEVMLSNPFSTVNNLIDQGKLKVLATTGPQRAPNQPNVPTLAELGVPEGNISSQFGFIAPANTPAHIVNRLHQVAQEQIATPAMQEALRATDNVALRMTPQEFGQLLERESNSNAEIIRKANIQL